MLINRSFSILVRSKKLHFYFFYLLVLVKIRIHFYLIKINALKVNSCGVYPSYGILFIIFVKKPTSIRFFSKRQCFVFKFYFYKTPVYFFYKIVVRRTANKKQT